MNMIAFQQVDLFWVQDEVSVLPVGQNIVHRHNTVRPGGAAGIWLIDWLIDGDNNDDDNNNVDDDSNEDSTCCEQ